MPLTPPIGLAGIHNSLLGKPLPAKTSENCYIFESLCLNTDAPKCSDCEFFITKEDYQKLKALKKHYPDKLTPEEKEFAERAKKQWPKAPIFNQSGECSK